MKKQPRRTAMLVLASALLGAAFYAGVSPGLADAQAKLFEFIKTDQFSTVKTVAANISGSRLVFVTGVSNRGLMRFMLYDGALNVDRFITFLRRLIKDAEQKVFLVVDNLRVHHAHKVKAWIASHAHEIELFYLPAYAPDHNPDEYMNNDLKQKLRQKPQPASKHELVTTTRGVMRAIQRSPERIRAYFTPEPVRYAA